MRIVLAAILLLALLLFVSTDVGIYVDYLWFRANGFESVFFTTLGYELRTFLVFGAIALLFFLLNLLIARRAAGARRPAPRTLYGPENTVPVPLGLGIAAAAVIVALLFGGGARTAWSTVALAAHPVSVGVADPILNRPVDWYLFQLPYLHFLAGWATALLVVTGLGVGTVYLVAAPGFLQLERMHPDFGPTRLAVAPPRAVVVHGAILLALYFLLRGATYHWLSQADLLLAPHSTAFGANYVDVHVRMPAYGLLAGVMGLCMVCCVLAALGRGRGWLVAGPALWVTAAVLGLGLIPAVIQAIVVGASELQRESVYIANNIAATRAAFDLEAITVGHPTVTTLTAEDVRANPQTIDNVRLWDWRPLLQTYQQLQGLRPYYVFPDVDVDRYGGKQMMLATRELDITKLPAAAQNWQNQHLVYTHGYGIVASTTNGLTSEGRPDLILRDIPPTTDNPLLKVTRPGVYFGEHSSDWVLVRTKASEFDYPRGTDNASTRYDGKVGIGVGTLPRRLLFAWALGDPYLVFTSYIQPDSEILIHRDIRDIVHRLTPFLTFDRDPYMVIVDGKLSWILDGYTTSDHYPYAAPLPNGTNYMRNSVKVIVDAYDGTVTYYRADDPAHPEPLIQAYSTIFPGLFHPLAEMPASYRDHVRYPEDFLAAQATILGLYHITDPGVFYNREDVWALPTEQVGDTRTVLAPYYVEIRLPDEQQAEYVLIQPFIPRGKDNMVGWLAARSDPAHYGQALLYEFSKDSLIFGPQQIEARIDQDPVISSNLTLWNQQGSSVIRGNLLVIPLGSAFLYIEPLFLQAKNGQIPQLTRIILATGNTIRMEDSFAGALQALFNGSPVGGQGGTGAGQPAAGSSGAGAPSTAASLAQDALRHYQQAQAALHNGDWAGYGTELAAMQRDLEQLAKGTATP